MMNKQNDEVLSEDKNIYSHSYSGDECIKADGVKIPVKKDSKTVNDDIDDYIFTRKRIVKKTKHEENNTSAYSEKYELVKSDRSNDRVKRSKHRHRPKRHRMKLWKKVLISIGCFFLSVILLAVGTLTCLFFKGSSELLDGNYTITAPEGVETQNDGEFVVYNGKTYQYNKNVTNILFMGIDKRELEETEVLGTGGQADVIVLLAVDTKTGKISMINISRDTMTDVTVYSANGGYVGSETQQLCLSYAYGDGKEKSCENTVNSVKRLFYNIPIKTYLALDLDGIAAVNDSVGGVDVTSPETIENFVKGQNYHLEGQLAESFVRSRSHESADANTLRMQRQQVYVTQFMNKVISATKENITTPVDLFNASSPYTCTNLNPSRVLYLAESIVMSDGMSVEMSTVPGESKMGKTYAEYYVNESEFYELFLSVFYTPVQ
ncbi:MAG: LCP family protein [Ruminococcus sp.]